MCKVSNFLLKAFFHDKRSSLLRPRRRRTDLCRRSLLSVLVDVGRKPAPVAVVAVVEVVETALPIEKPGIR
jgi:hypothetical protein